MIESKKIAIKGMHCAACVTRIEKTLSRLDGVKSVHVNLATEQGKVIFDRNVTALPQLLERIDSIGFEAKEIERDSGLLHADDDLKKIERSFFLSLILTIPFAWAMFAHIPYLKSVYIPPLLLHPLFQFCFAFPIQFMIGFPFYKRAWQALKNRSATMDLLVVLSTSAAFFYSHYLTMKSLQMNTFIDSSQLFYETSAFIITFVLLGKMLEAKTKRKTTEAMSQFYELQTKTATKIVNKEEKSVPVQMVKRGEMLLVKAGEKIPLDGEVVHGHSTVNESLLNGESIPVEKRKGDTVYAGTVNQHGQLVMKVTKTYEDTALANIIRIVEEAQMEKAPIQKTVDKVTEYFVPTVIVIALVAFSYSYFIVHPGVEYEAIKRLIAVLIIACPCALGLATPTSITVGSGRAAKSGILFKDGKILERFSKSTIAIFDKTGTVTKGEPVVTNMFIEEGDEETFLKAVGALERASTHPIAKAMMDFVKKKHIYVPLAERVEELPGYGIRGTVDSHEITIASPAYFGQLPIKMRQTVQALQREGKSVVIVFIDGKCTGCIAVSDEIKRHAKGVIAKLKKMGLHVIMLSGDHRLVVKSVANELHIDSFEAEMTPIEKAKRVEHLQKQGHIVAMIGDGVNDAPALAKADVGISLGAGSDIAIDSSNVTIISSDLHHLVQALLISKKTMRNIKQNLSWAFFYNGIMIPFAAVGIFSPSFAGMAMALSSVTVVLNALRLKNN